MKKLDRYILRQFIGPFIAILCIVVFILLLQFLWLYIDELVGKGLSLKIILEFLGWGAATMLPLSLPLATILASVMTMGNFAENYELTAIKSAGISLSRVLRPLTITSFLIATGAFFVVNNLVPKAYNNIYTLSEDIRRTKDEIKIPSKTFYDGIEGYVLRVESNDRKSDMMHGVMVYNHSENRGNISLTLADSASMKMSKDKDYLTFAMFNGINYEESNSQNYQDTVRQLNRTEFKKQEIIIPIENYAFQKTAVGRYSDQAKSMRLDDLIKDKDSIKVDLGIKRAEELAAIRCDLNLSYGKQMDTAQTYRRRSLFPLDSVRTGNLAEETMWHQTAISHLNSYRSTFQSFDMESKHLSFTLKLIDIEIYRKFSIALICFLLFFIGAPLGAVIRKGGLGTPAIVSILFFVLYYIIDMVGTKLARDGSIDPVTGAFIASYILLPICAFLTYKATNDSTMFSFDSIRSLNRKLKVKMKEMFKKTRIVYMGTPEFSVAPLKALLAAGYDVVAVVTVPDKPAGRGQSVSESAVKKFATAQGIPVLQPEKLKNPDFLEELKSYKPDLIVVVAFRLLPQEVWSIPSLGTFNLHAALLPQYRGAAPINWAVINGEKSTGVTSFLIDSGVDTGTVLLRERYSIKPEDTASDVHDALMEMGSHVVVQTVEGLIEKNIDSRIQKSFIQGEEVLHKAPKLSRELCHIDWNDSAKHVVNLIRGLSDYPCAYTELINGENVTALKVFKAHAEGWDALGINDAPAPGTIVSDGKDYLAVAATDKAVVLDEVQLSGKKRMATGDFLRGFHDPCSYTTSQGSSRSVMEAVHDSERNQ